MNAYCVLVVSQTTTIQGGQLPSLELLLICRRNRVWHPAPEPAGMIFIYLPTIPAGFSVLQPVVDVASVIKSKTQRGEVFRFMVGQYQRELKRFVFLTQVATVKRCKGLVEENHGGQVLVNIHDRTSCI